MAGHLGEQQGVIGSADVITSDGLVGSFFQCIYHWLEVVTVHCLEG